MSPTTPSPSLNELKFKRVISHSDLSGPHLLDYISLFNRRLTRRMSSRQMQIVTVAAVASTADKDQWVLEGGVKINFKFLRPVRVRNELRICQEDNKKDVIITDFKFSNKSVLVVPANNKDTTLDLLAKIRALFHIVPKGGGHDSNVDNHGDQLFFFERELSISQQDIFYRRLSDDELPLELNLLWNVNQERKSLVLTDHDPNETHYANCDVDQLDKKLISLSAEEEDLVRKVRQKFDLLRREMLKGRRTGDE